MPAPRLQGKKLGPLVLEHLLRKPCPVSLGLHQQLVELLNLGHELVRVGAERVVRGAALLDPVHPRRGLLGVDAFGLREEGGHALAVRLKLVTRKLAHVRVEVPERGVLLLRLRRHLEAILALRHHVERKQDGPQQRRSQQEVLAAVVALFLILIVAVVVKVGRQVQRGLDGHLSQQLLHVPDLGLADPKPILHPQVLTHQVGPNHGLVHAVVGPPELVVVGAGHILGLDHVKRNVLFLLLQKVCVLPVVWAVLKGTLVGQVDDMGLAAVHLFLNVLLHGAATRAHGIAVWVHLKPGPVPFAFRVRALVRVAVPLQRAPPSLQVVLLLLRVLQLLLHPPLKRPGSLRLKNRPCVTLRVGRRLRCAIVELLRAHALARPLALVVTVMQLAVVAEDPVEIDRDPCQQHRPRVLHSHGGAAPFRVTSGFFLCATYEHGHVRSLGRKVLPLVPLGSYYWGATHHFPPLPQLRNGG